MYILFYRELGESIGLTIEIAKFALLLHVTTFENEKFILTEK